MDAPPPPYERHGVETQAGTGRRRAGPSLLELVARPDHKVRLERRDLGRRQERHRRPAGRLIPRLAVRSFKRSANTCRFFARAIDSVPDRRSGDGTDVRNAPPGSPGPRLMKRNNSRAANTRSAALREHGGERRLELAGISSRIQIDDPTGLPGVSDASNARIRPK